MTNPVRERIELGSVESSCGNCQRNRRRHDNQERMALRINDETIIENTLEVPTNMLERDTMNLAWIYAVTGT
jgi:hypothetical protein